jgi:quercetin dioxygenase-like cupin family protein
VVDPIRFEEGSPWTQVGDGVRVRPLVEGGRTCLMLYRIEPGAQYTLHSHGFEEFGLVLSGEMVLMVPGSERTTRAGDAYYFGADTPHGCRVPIGGSEVLLVDVSTELTPGRDRSQSAALLELAKVEVGRALAGSPPPRPLS